MTTRGPRTESAGRLREIGAERDALRYSAMGVSAPADSATGPSHSGKRISGEEPRLRDRSRPIIVTRTSSVRAVVGDDGRRITWVLGDVDKSEK